MGEELELIIMDLINNSGEAKSICMEAIAFAKDNDINSARIYLEKADEKISLAHKSQTKLIQNEAKGVKEEFSLLLVHAQDHLMGSIMMKDIAREFVDLYEIMYKK
ncbi:MAG TPA: PTS lactose/cellobiose transporter subunit IIA [Soehngenia sp.]|nr:PTS lactose/cellobiose transporter subunit IIA [Soehngenia sp.]HPP31443.1 PTS lactose/cellobiose transporter subunit IIA [Soehngenia sp.]